MCTHFKQYLAITCQTANVHPSRAPFFFATGVERVGVGGEVEGRGGGVRRKLRRRVG